MADTANQQVVIVAIPQEDDYVWKVSSEKIPHMTLLYLGETEVTQRMTDFIEHASSLMQRFGLNVDRRGTLGDKEADVLFFKGWGLPRVKEFRAQLLQNQEINKAYQSATQFPEWTPHLTLGFPETPAKPSTRDHGIGWVEFDRIAIWTGDSEGPTFQLDSYSDSSLDVAMSDLPQLDLEDILEHYGVKGMKWGVRKKRSRQTSPDSEDETRVSGIKTGVKTQKTTRHLSNQELEDAIKRMRLQQEFSKLSGGIDKTRTQKSKAFVAKLLGDAGKQGAQQITNNETKSLFENAMRNAKAGR